jgi:hypothetical protein
MSGTLGGALIILGVVAYAGATVCTADRPRDTGWAGVVADFGLTVALAGALVVASAALDALRGGH